MSDEGRRSPSPALWVAIAAAVLALCLPIVATVPGRSLGVRVLLAAAIVLGGVAAAESGRDPDRAKLFVTLALASVALSAALLIRFVNPVGTVLLGLAIGGLWWQRRAWAR